MAEKIYECDLHVHTTASDGGWGPDEVVARAAVRGVKTIAITDHDTMAGIAKALAAGEKHDVDIIPGVELTTIEGNHMLGYYVGSGDNGLTEYLAELRLKSLAYMRSVVGEMRETLGLEFTPDDLEHRTGGGIPNMSHLLDLLHSSGRLTSPRFDSEEAVALFGDSDYLVSYYRTFARTKPFTDTAGAIRLIREAGGVAVWAHPAYRSEPDESYIMQLKNRGLAGLEVVTPKHDSVTRDKLRDICNRLNLIPTGGTDYHGRYFESIEHGSEIGCCGVAAGTVDQLLKRAGEFDLTGTG